MPLKKSGRTGEPRGVEAARIAEFEVKQSLRSGPWTDDVRALEPQLVVFHTGLVQGVGGQNHLAYRVEVVNDPRSVREFVFVDAHSGKVLDRITGIQHGLDREIYTGGIEPEYLVWEEGDTLPFTGTDEEAINALIDFAEDSKNFFITASGGTYTSFDGADATMLSVFDDPGLFCFIAANAATGRARCAAEQVSTSMSTSPGTTTAARTRYRSTAKPRVTAARFRTSLSMS